MSLWHIVFMSFLLTISDFYEKDHNEFGHGRCVNDWF